MHEINFVLNGAPRRVIVDPQFSWQREWDALVDGISHCNEMAKRNGLKLCLEPRVGESVSNTDALLRLFDTIPDRNFGAVLDTGHQNAQKEILPLSVEKLGDRIFYVHVSDNDGRTNHHLPLGQGTIDWEGVFLALKKHKFEGICGDRFGPYSKHRPGVYTIKNIFREFGTKTGSLRKCFQIQGKKKLDK
jgi:sugar phosphate isomerase/epimerase